jgi:hypothetical protein
VHRRGAERPDWQDSRRHSTGAAGEPWRLAWRKENGMTIDEIINKTVMFMIFNHEGLEGAGIKERKFYAKVVGRDSIGLWIENPKLETTRMRNEQGYIIPPEQRKHEVYMAHILIPWGNIRSLVHFPMRQGFDTVEDEEAKSLGRGLYL